MKKTLILFTVAAVLFGSACNDDSDDYRLSLITGPAINALPYKQITLSDNENDFISLSWSQAKFFINGAAQSSPSAPVQYSLLIKQADSDTAGVVFSSTANLHSEISADKLNSFVINNFGVEPGDTVNLSFLVSASYGEGSPKNVLSQNSVDLSVITFVSQKPTLENIYICGDMNSWNNSGTEFLMFKTNNDMSDYNYTYTGYFAQGAAFKFISASALGSWDNLYYSAGDGNMILGNSADDSFSVTDAGYYTININTKNLTFEILPFDASAAPVYSDIEFVGQFCNWGAASEDPEMIKSDYDPHQWSLTVDIQNIEYGVKFRTGHDWANRWCAAVKDDFPYGTALFNPVSDDNILISSVGSYIVRFNDLTGSYYIGLKN